MYHGGEFDCVFDNKKPDADADAAHEILLYHLAINQLEDIPPNCSDLSFLIGHEGQGEDGDG
jgi:hypothetical protein